MSGKMTKGAAWMVGARLGDRLIGLMSTIVLARLLVPADFGLVVMATAILAGLQLLAAFSFDVALIQNPHAERRHYDTVWTLGIIFCSALAIVLILLAGPASRFYGEPRLAPIMYVLSIGMFLEGFINVGIVSFRKEMQFEKEFKFLLSKKLVAVITTVTLAFVWRDYWALVAGTIMGTVVALVLSYLWQPYRPRLSMDARKELFSFSQWLFFNNTLTFLYHRAADFVLAKGVGAEGLGHYSVAYDIANLPSSEIVAPVHRAVFPGYAKMASDIAIMRQGFLNVLSLVALLAIPAAVGMACVANPLVNVFLGDKWAPIVPLIQVLAINGVLAALWTCSAYVYLALGRPRTITLVLGLHVTLAVPMVAWAAFHWNIVGVTWILLATSLLIMPLNYLVLSAALQLTARALLKVLWRPLAAAGMMATVVTASPHHLLSGPDLTAQLSSLILLVVYGAAVYSATIILLWWLCSRPSGAESFLLDRMKSTISGMRRAFQEG
jgi:O-antigen/teichoic acid export membrane protein